MPVTVLGPGGYPRRPYGSFAGKTAFVALKGLVTVLGPGGYPRPPYASFAGKTPAVVIVADGTKHRGFTQNVGKMVG